jgi:GxxExxY protein
MTAARSDPTAEALLQAARDAATRPQEMEMRGIRGDEGDDAGADRLNLTYAVIEAIIKVHSELGPGFLEAIYQRALAIELKKRGIAVATETEVIISYDGHVVGRHRLDLVVDNRVIVEVKTVEELGRTHYAQVRSYLRATGFPVALLVNFSKERADYRRIERKVHCASAWMP